MYGNYQELQIQVLIDPEEWGMEEGLWEADTSWIDLFDVTID